jgi:hypothetical protein
MLGKDWPFAGNPLGNLSDTQQGSFEQGDVDCADGIADLGAHFQHVKDFTYLMLQMKGTAGSVEREAENPFFGAWKGRLMKVKTEVDGALRKILQGLEVLGCIPDFGRT